MKPRLLLVGGSRYSLPLAPSLERKFAALEAELDLRVLARAGSVDGGDPRFHLVRSRLPRALQGPAFYARLPVLVARELRRFAPHAVLVQGAQETALTLLGRSLARSEAKVVADLHGDPASATRLYGSSLRRALSPLAAALARAGLRRADGVRTLSPFTNEIAARAGATPTAVFAAFMDLEPFLGPPAPLPQPSAALFVGVLERYKGIDVLAQAWREAASRLPGATLHVVGRGRLERVVRGLVAALPQQTRWTEALPTEGVSDALDEASILVLPSRSEGLPRIVVEAFCRGRGVIGSRAGGIPDLVVEGENGLLVPPGDARALADALVWALSDRERMERFGAQARTTVEPWVATPEEYARRVRDLVEEVVSGRAD